LSLFFYAKSAILKGIGLERKYNMSTRQSLFRCFPKIILSMLFLLCAFASAPAADVSLIWDPSITPDVSGYKVYVGTSSGIYGAPITIGNQTSYTVTGLSNGTYYFVVTSFDLYGNESDFSNEVSATIGTPAVGCDINGDNSVNVVDLQALANVVLGIDPAAGSDDLSGDGKVDVVDLQILINVILGLRSCP
jgi:hypothetical protein